MRFDASKVNQAIDGTCNKILSVLIIYHILFDVHLIH